MKNKSLCIYKFGGASVKSAQGVRNLAEIVRDQSSNLIVVVSAMGKTTNALENILSGYLERKNDYWGQYYQLKEFHLKIAEDLFTGDNVFAICVIQDIFRQMEEMLEKTHGKDYNYNYDQFVCFGEILSSTIISLFLNAVGISNTCVDIRSCLKTDSNYREGNVDYAQSKELCKRVFIDNNQKFFITQGFIAGTNEGKTTTLGREGSDYTAALLGNLLDATSVTIWKDVEGVLNADPRIFSNTKKLEELSFKEAIELAYCGAQIIHPKTIKPLQNKQIPLHVKSFLNPFEPGTLVYQTDKRIEYPPILILKSNQVLISLTPRDFSFVIEDCLSKIFSILYMHRVKANLVQSSAISFSICVEEEKHFLPGALDELQKSYSVRYNKNLDLLTIRHYTKESIAEHTNNRQILLQQLTRSTARFVLTR